MPTRAPFRFPLVLKRNSKVVDLVTMKAYFWHDETMGADYDEAEVPSDLMEEAQELREKMLETVAEFDDRLMEKFFEDPSSITVEEIKRAIRKGRWR